MKMNFSLLLNILLTTIGAHRISSTSEGECFYCGDNSSECISDNYRCDGYQDCSDGSDEINCGECFYCGDNSSECISDSYRCNGYQDCSDGSDEINCEYCKGDSFRCDNGKCIDGNYACDNIYDCEDNSDETPQKCGECLSTNRDFPCGGSSTLCIYSSTRCNGVQQCPNGADELNCESCDYDSFKCDNGQCIQGIYACDDIDDCEDKSDEAAQKCGECLSTNRDFPCGGSSTLCIYSNDRCDGVQQCPNGEDELNCGECLSTTGGRTFSCGGKSTKCIPDSFKCDDFFDCSNGADELDCGDFSCGDGHFIQVTKICDGSKDCNDGIDENVWHCAAEPINMPEENLNDAYFGCSRCYTFDNDQRKCVLEASSSCRRNPF